MRGIIRSVSLVLLIFGNFSSFAQFTGHHTYMATLKEEIAPVDIMVGEYVLFSIYAEDEFIYDSYGKQAWMPNGKFGKVDEDMIVRIPNVKYFKFDHSLEYFTLYEGHELIAVSSAKGIDYQQLLTNSIGGNENDLQQLFLLMNVLNGTAYELHKTMMWKVFNRWDDTAFAEFFVAQHEDLQKEIGKFLFKPATIWPIEDHTSYFSEYYPETFDLILKYKDL